ncbi:DUF421 domain-containing protein [Lichenicoccus sp.]|uniref:DUF421 domain-containing protein n=1 Tax=Lichenicoccus sp. TaxID=2781899 RepID=UPI003D0C13F7
MFTIVFGSGPHLTWAQECARGALVFFFCLLLVRLSGRRSFSRWSPLDTVVSIIVGSTLSRTLTGNAELIGTLAATTLIVLLHGALAKGAAYVPFISALVEGQPVTLGTVGQHDPRKLKRHSVSPTDLEEAMRAAGIGNVADTSRITLEPSGKITFLKS